MRSNKAAREVCETQPGWMHGVVGQHCCFAPPRTRECVSAQTDEPAARIVPLGFSWRTRTADVYCEPAINEQTWLQSSVAETVLQLKLQPARGEERQNLQP